MRRSYPLATIAATNLSLSLSLSLSLYLCQPFMKSLGFSQFFGAASRYANPFRASPRFFAASRDGALEGKPHVMGAAFILDLCRIVYCRREPVGTGSKYEARCRVPGRCREIRAPRPR
jgi:hypothetical protein